MKRSTGFTLFELLVTLSIVAIIATIALPSFTRFIAQNELNTAARELRTALMLARSEAVKRSETVYVKRNTDWSDGLLVTTNSARTYAECVAAATADCIRLFQPVVGDLTVTASDATATRLDYLRSGRAETNLTFTLCPTPATGFTERNVVIGTTGIPEIEDGGDC